MFSTPFSPVFFFLVLPVERESTLPPVELNSSSACFTDSLIVKGENILG